MKKEALILFGKMIAAILVALAATEIILRLLGFPSVNTNTFDAHNLVIFKPDREFLVKDRCYESVIKTNDIGFHSASYPKKKPAGTFRIAVLGDSFVEAVQVPLEKTLSSILERKLNSAGGGTRYEVIPIAKSGNGTLMNVLYAREYALKFEPDIIIDAFITNDLEDDYTADKTLHAASAGGIYDSASLYLSSPASGSRAMLSLKHFLLERSLLFERWWMNAMVIKNQLNQKEAQASEPSSIQIDAFVEAQMEPQSAVAKDMWAKEEKALNTFARFADDNHAKFLLVHLAEGYLIDPPELKSRYHLSKEQAKQFRPDMVRERLANIAMKGGFSFFSTAPFLEKNFKETGRLPVFSCDNHYNELGHEWAAEAIFRFLTEPSAKLLPTDE